jgi:hypothetical protein
MDRESSENGTDFRGISGITREILPLEKLEGALRLNFQPSCHPGGKMQAEPGFGCRSDLAGNEHEVLRFLTLGEEKYVKGMPVSQAKILQRGAQLGKCEDTFEFPDLIIGSSSYLKVGQHTDLLVLMVEVSGKIGGPLPGM